MQQLLFFAATLVQVAIHAREYALLSIVRDQPRARLTVDVAWESTWYIMALLVGPGMCPAFAAAHSLQLIIAVFAALHFGGVVALLSRSTTANLEKAARAPSSRSSVEDIVLLFARGSRAATCAFDALETLALCAVLRHAAAGVVAPVATAALLAVAALGWRVLGVLGAMARTRLQVWRSADVIVVLGGAAEREAAGARLACSSEYRAARLIVSSGCFRRVEDFDPDDPSAYAPTLFAGADSRGKVDFRSIKARLALDRRAVDTVTNFTSLAAELRQGGCTRVLVVTSDYHVPRSRAIARVVLGSCGIAFDMHAALLNNDAAVVHVQDDEARPLRTGRATPLQTGLNMLNELEGQGLLGLSYTYVYSGWASVGCLLLCGGMAGFTGYALAMCMYDEHGVRVRDTYAAAGRACFGRAGARAVLVTQMTNLMCVCVVYLVLIGSTLDSVHKLVDDDDDAWQWLPHANQRIWTALATVAALPTVHVGGYKNVSWLSAAGTTIMVAIVIMGVAISAQHISEHGAAPMPALDITKVPAAFSMFIFAFSCHGIFPDLESSMAEPRHFQKVVGVVFSSNILVKAVFSLLGFFAFGTATMAVVTSNFATTPRTVISVLIAVNTWLSFPLPLVPVFNALTRAGVGGSRAARALQRSGIVLVCGAAALALPNFGVAMGLAGSLMLSFLTFIFPAVFFLRLHRPNLSAPTVACCYAVACVGALGCVSGLASNISILVNG